jgi:hypothetical protein
MKSYDNTIAILEEQLKVKQKLIDEVSVIGESKNENTETNPTKLLNTDIPF